MILYDLVISRGHLIIELADGKYIIDTGSPASFGPNSLILFDGKEYHSNTQMMAVAQLDNISVFIGVPLNGLIGCDILRNYCIVLDLNKKKMIIKNDYYVNGGDTLVKTDMELLPMYGLPLINIEINHPFKAFIDTGATISYIKLHYTNNMQPIRQENDFHPMVGNFVADIFSFNVKIEGSYHNIELGVLPLNLEGLFANFGADAVLGYDLFKDKIVIFDYFLNKFIIKKP